MITENQEHLMCNICGITINASDIKQHLVTMSHASKKSKLEQEYNVVVEKNYQDDVSVIAGWERGIDRNSISLS